jgi:DNA-binding FadR family transcriptional regulator
MARPGRPERHKAEDDLNFHMAVAKASGAPVYMHLMGVLSGILEDMFAYHRYRLQIGPQYDRLLLAQHKAIAVTIQARDGDAAARAMAEHLETVLSSYAEHQDPEPDSGQGKLRIASG